MKAYTDIEQSKKLAEILPLESADMLFQLGEDKYADSIKVPLTKKHWEQMMPDINPCWSLAALLGVLPEGYSSILTKSSDGKDYYCKLDSEYIETITDNPVDACYEMITKLKERNLL